jgi:hypothetical protein
MFRDETIFAQASTTRRSKLVRRGLSEDLLMQKPTTFHDDSANETIVAREPESSVSHFIDGNRAARRLCPSLGRCQARQHSNGESHENVSKVVDRSFTAVSAGSN